MVFAVRVVVLLFLMSGAALAAKAQAPSQVRPDTVRIGEKIYSYVEQMPAFPGGHAALFQTIGQTIQYPTEALQQKLEGRIFVSFVVGTSGKVQDVKVSKGVHALLDAEAARAVSSLPAFSPGKQNGRPVQVAYTLPITFKLPLDLEAQLAERAKAAPGKIASNASLPTQAQFGSSSEALSTFLSSVPYPDAARASRKEGRVYVQFELSTTGQVEKVMAVPRQGTNKPGSSTSRTHPPTSLPDPLLVEAAVRHIATMPAWKPATHNGTPVATTQYLPVDFRLTPPAAEEVEYAYTEQMPVFEQNNLQFPFPGNIAASIRYPVDALRHGIQGESLIYFVLNENGRVEQAEVVRSSHPLLDAEALRAVQNQRAIAPAYHRGKRAKLFYFYPAKFVIK